MARGFIAIIWNYFDAYFSLRALILAIYYLSKRNEEHTALRIFEAVITCLNNVIGPEWIRLLYFCVTDYSF